jgi:hypothetical protein
MTDKDLKLRALDDDFRILPIRQIVADIPELAQIRIG